MYCFLFADSVCPNNIDEEAGVNCTFSKRNACNYTTESIKGTGDWMYKSYSTTRKNLPFSDVSERSYGKLMHLLSIHFIWGTWTNLRDFRKLVLQCILDITVLTNLHKKL